MTRVARSAGQCRSLIYVPGYSEKMLGKASRLPADLVVFDLEDGVHPDQKTLARDKVQSALVSADSLRYVRINGLDTPWGAEDLEMVSESNAYPVLPKAQNPDTVLELLRATGCREALLMIETAAGVLNAAALAQIDAVSGLVFGAADFRASVGALPTDQEAELVFARHQILLAARSGGCDAIDSPWFDFRDFEGLRGAAERAKRMGFDGKSAIHPEQLPPIHEVFRPTADELEWAERVRDALASAKGRAQSMAVLDGGLVEEPHLRLAERLLTWEESAKRDER